MTSKAEVNLLRQEALLKAIGREKKAKELPPDRPYRMVVVFPDHTRLDIKYSPREAWGHAERWLAMGAKVEVV